MVLETSFRRPPQPVTLHTGGCEGKTSPHTQAETRSLRAGSPPYGRPTRPTCRPHAVSWIQKLLVDAEVGEAGLVEGLGMPRHHLRLLGVDLRKVAPRASTGPT